MPTKQFKLSTSYRLPDGNGASAAACAGKAMSTTKTIGPVNYRTEQDAYAIVDAMVGYRHNQNLDFQLNITNLFDKIYYSAINAQPAIWGGNTVYGEPRNFMLAGRYKF